MFIMFIDLISGEVCISRLQFFRSALCKFSNVAVCAIAIAVPSIFLYITFLRNVIIRCESYLISYSRSVVH